MRRVGKSAWLVNFCLLFLAAPGPWAGSGARTAQSEEAAKETPPARQRFADALAELRRGRLQQAADALSALAQEYAQTEPALAAEALFRAAQIHDEQLSHLARAQELYRETAQRYPQSRFAERAQRRAAELAALRAADPDPAVLAEFNQLASAYLTLGPEALIARLRGFIAQHPDFAQADRATYLLGIAYRGAGAAHAPAAVQTLSRVLTAYPGSAWGPHARQALAELALRQGDYATARRHFAALARSAEPIWTESAARGLQACTRALWRRRLAQACWSYLLCACAVLALRARGKLLPPPLEVFYYAPVAGFQLLVSGLLGDVQVRRPMAVLALLGTALAWLSGAAARRRDNLSLWRGAVLRTTASLTLLYLVFYHGHLIDLLIDTWKMGPESG